MLILAFDTATPATTVALLERGGNDSTVLARFEMVDARRHGEALAPAIDEVLTRAGRGRVDITDIAVGVGPGPYTGLRVGVATARALGWALGVPVRGVCTLDIIAHAAARDIAEPFLVVTDARRREVYWARYDALGHRLAGPAVSPAHQIESLSLPAFGEGPRLYPDAFLDRREPELPDAAALAELVATPGAEAASWLPAEPLYLRRPDARVPGAPKPVTPA